MERTFPDAASIGGWTKHDKRMELLRAFRSGEIPVMISKGKIIGLGLNLQIARHHVFSGIQDSYQTWWQCLKRSNRYGSDEPLDAHVPCTDVEYPMFFTVIKKMNRIREDNEIQEALFKRESGYATQQ
jgi:hypothetical protein